VGHDLWLQGHEHIEEHRITTFYYGTQDEFQTGSSKNNHKNKKKII